MLRVKVDIVPYGEEGKSSQIGEMLIANVSNIGFGQCTYDAAILHGDGIKEFKHVAHYRQDGFWELVKKVLNEEGVDELSDTMKILDQRFSINIDNE